MTWLVPLALVGSGFLYGAMVFSEGWLFKRTAGLLIIAAFLVGQVGLLVFCFILFDWWVGAVMIPLTFFAWQFGGAWMVRGIHGR